MFKIEDIKRRSALSEYGIMKLNIYIVAVISATRFSDKGHIRENGESGFTSGQAD